MKIIVVTVIYEGQNTIQYNTIAIMWSPKQILGSHVSFAVTLLIDTDTHNSCYPNFNGFTNLLEVNL